jgi:hypothetical protein
MRTVCLGLLLCCVMGCSWTFQNRLSGGIAAYDPAEPPDCGGYGWPVTDLVFATLGLAAIGRAGADDTLTTEQQTRLALSGIATGIVHATSAVFGLKHARECHHAHRLWWAGGGRPGLTDDEKAERARLAAQFAAQNKSTATAAPTPAPTPPTSGCFCAKSASAGLCTRAEIDCLRAHDFSTTDPLGPCIVVAVAWCFAHDRCAPTKQICDVARTRENAETECVEAR